MTAGNVDIRAGAPLHCGQSRPTARDREGEPLTELTEAAIAPDLEAAEWLVATLRERYRPVLARDGALAPVRAEMPDRAHWPIGDDEPAFLEVVGRGGLVPTGDRKPAP